MRRSLIIVLLALGAGAAVFFASWRTAAKVCSACVQSHDELGWLRAEFHLSDAEMQQVRQLHEGYLPKCHEMCGRIAAKKLDLEAALDGTTNLTAEARSMISDLAALRAQCQTQMLAHFYEVSQAMPAAEGKRYLEEMRRMTLGLSEQTEQTMSGMAMPDDGHHH